MADYKVGNLQIVFDTLNQTDEGFKKLASNLRSVQKAIAKIGDIDLKPFVANIKEITKSFSPLLADINGASGALKDFNEVTKRLGISRVSQVAQEFQNLGKEIETANEEAKEIGNGIREGASEIKAGSTRAKKSFEELVVEEYKATQEAKKQRIEFLQAALALDKAGDKTEEYRKELEELTYQQKKSDDATKKGTNSFGKLFKSLKRIAVYRILRTVLKEISQSFTETVKAFAEVDDGINSTMSNITSSLSVIKLSFGSIILPLLQMIEPIIQQIAIAFANLANVIGQAMSTSGTYTKINAEYWKDYREQLEKTKGSLTDFDKIRALNTPTSGGLSDALIPDKPIDESNEKVLKLRETLSELREVLSNVFDILKRVGSPIVEVFLEVLNIAIKVISPLIDMVADFVKRLDEMGLLEPIIRSFTYALLAFGAVKVINGIRKVAEGISKINLSSLGLYATIGILLGGLSYFISSLDEMSSSAKLLIPIIAALAAAFTGVAVAKAAAAAGIAAPIKAGVTAAAIAAGITLAAGTAIALGKFADGGIPSTGTLFYAGEAGAETVTVGNSGRTEVTNVSQMETALYNALVRYGRENRGTDGVINISIDGQKVFEATRRTANKRGLDFSRI